MQTSIRVSQTNRKALTQIARDLGGMVLDTALTVLIFEHRAAKAVARLQADPQALADYRDEAHQWASLDTEVTG